MWHTRRALCRTVTDVRPWPWPVLQVRLCKGGDWCTVIVDDCFPTRHGHPLYGHSRRGELWVALLEKAMASIHGGYSHIEAGTETEALVFLTGYVP